MRRCIPSIKPSPCLDRKLSLDLFSGIRLFVFEVSFCSRTELTNEPYLLRVSVLRCLRLTKMHDGGAALHTNSYHKFATSIFFLASKVHVSLRSFLTHGIWHVILLCVRQGQGCYRHQRGRERCWRRVYGLIFAQGCQRLASSYTVSLKTFTLACKLWRTALGAALAR
jgi:hypothetical protein